MRSESRDRFQRDQVVGHAFDDDLARRGGGIGVDRVDRGVVQAVRAGVVAGQVPGLLHGDRVRPTVGHDEHARCSAARDRRGNLCVQTAERPRLGERRTVAVAAEGDVAIGHWPVTATQASFPLRWSEEALNEEGRSV